MKTIRDVEGYEALTDEQRQLLEGVYASHMRAFSEETRERYTPDKVKEVKWDPKDKTVNIYFEDIWWHYNAKGEWY